VRGRTVATGDGEPPTSLDRYEEAPFLDSRRPGGYVRAGP